MAQRALEGGHCRCVILRSRGAPLQLDALAQLQLQLAGCLLRKRDGDNLVHLTPARMTLTIRLTSAVVLPVPAAASTTSVRSRAVAMDRALADPVAASWTAPQLGKVLKQRRVLAGGAPVLGRPAHRLEVTVRAHVWARRRHEPPELDRAIHDLERFDTKRTRALDERNLVRFESPCRSAEVQSA